MGGYYQTSALFWVVFVTLLQYSQGKPNNKIVCLPKNFFLHNRADKFRLEFLPFHFKFRSVPRKKNLLFSHILIKTLALGILLVCQNMFRDKAWRDLENLSEFVIKMQK